MHGKSQQFELRTCAAERDTLSHQTIGRFLPLAVARLSISKANNNYHDKEAAIKVFFTMRDRVRLELWRVARQGHFTFIQIIIEIRVGERSGFLTSRA